MELRLPGWFPADGFLVRGFEFDLVLVSHWLREPAWFIADTRAKGNVPAEETRYPEELWAQRKTQFLVYTRIPLRRRAGSERCSRFACNQGRA